MGQIFNRIKNLSKSYLHDDVPFMNVQYDINSENDELKKIINELSSQKTSNENNQNDEHYKSRHADINDAFKILGVKPEAPNEEIKAAFKTKMKEYHPDRLDNFGEEIKELAIRKTKEINEAYRLIRNNRGF